MCCVWLTSTLGFILLVRWLVKKAIQLDKERYLTFQADEKEED